MIQNLTFVLCWWFLGFLTMTYFVKWMLFVSVCAAVNFCKAASHGVLSRWRVRKGDREQCLGGPTVPLGQGCGTGHSQLSTRCFRWEIINLVTLQYCVVGTWSCKGIYLKRCIVIIIKSSTIWSNTIFVCAI